MLANSSNDVEPHPSRPARDVALPFGNIAVRRIICQLSTSLEFVQYPARLFLRKSETKGPKSFHKHYKCARHFAGFDRQAVDFRGGWVRRRAPRTRALARNSLCSLGGTGRKRTTKIAQFVLHVARFCHGPGDFVTQQGPITLPHVVEQFLHCRFANAQFHCQIGI